MNYEEYHAYCVDNSQHPMSNGTYVPKLGPVSPEALQAIKDFKGFDYEEHDRLLADMLANPDNYRAEVAEYLRIVAEAKAKTEPTADGPVNDGSEDKVD